MDDIDIKHDMLKESYYYNSPFYKYYCHFCMFKDYVKDISKNPPLYTYFIGFLKEYRKFDDRLRGVFIIHQTNIVVLREEVEEEKVILSLVVIIKKNKYLRFYVKYIIKQ